MSILQNSLIWTRPRSVYLKKDRLGRAFRLATTMYLIFSGTVEKSCAARGSVHSGGQLTESAFSKKRRFYCCFFDVKARKLPLGPCGLCVVRVAAEAM